MDNAPLDAQTVNDLQDGVISAHRGGAAFPFAGNIIGDQPDSVDLDFGFALYNGPAFFMVPILGIRPGDTLTKVEAYVVSARLVFFEVKLIDLATPEDSVVVMTQNVQGSGQLITFGGETEAVVGPGQYAVVTVNIAGGSGQTVVRGVAVETGRRVASA
ncbi:MAG: hypothetical protein AAGC55_04715 [Myxococcota bacterium]